MSKKKKITISIIASIIVIAIIVGTIGWLIGRKEQEKEETSIAKINVLYEKLKEKKEYTFQIKLDDNHQIYYAKKDNMAYVNTIYRGNEMTMLTRDGYVD